MKTTNTLVRIGMLCAVGASILTSCATERKEWTMVLDRNLAKAELIDGRYSDDWLVRAGEWESTPEGLHKKNAGREGSLLLRMPVVTGAVRIEYEAMSENPGDISLFMGTRPFAKTAPARAAFFGVGSKGNTMNRIAMPGAKTVIGKDLKLVAGQWHRVTIERAGGELSLAIDGDEVARTSDLEDGFAGPHIMLYVFNEAVFRSIRVWTKDDPAADAHLSDWALKTQQGWAGQPIAQVPPPSKLLKEKLNPFNITGRDNVYKQLHSFDHKGLSDEQFDSQVLGSLIKSKHSGSASEFYNAFIAAKHCTPEPGKANVEMADEILANTFTFYKEKCALGEKIDWEHNPGNDHWAHDLNRFSYITVLCNAAEETGDDRYTKKAVELILDWINATDVCDSHYWNGNKDLSPYVWQSYLNIAIHLGQWTAHIDRLAPHMTPHEVLVVMKSIHDQSAWLEEVIPIKVNNWVVIGSSGLINISARMQELKGSDRWMDFAWDQMRLTVDAQVLPDGAQFELTPHYHLLCARLYIGALISSTDAGVDVPDWVKPTVSKMLDFSMQTITSGDTLLAFNDSDPKGGPEARRLLVKIGKLLDRPDWIYVGTRGEEGTVPKVLSQAFEHAGVYIMRNGWDPNDSYLGFDGGPWGASHQHDDKLSFSLAGFGRDFIVDPGRYLYDASNPYSRDNYLNISRAHSTITVGGQTQADRVFKDQHVPGPKLIGNLWESEAGHDHVRAKHELGYATNASISATHERDLNFWHPGVVLIQDKVEMAEPNEVVSRLQFAPGDVVGDGNVWHTTYDDANVAVLPWMDAEFEVSVKKGQLDPTVGWYSYTINQIEPSPTLEVAAEVKDNLRGAFLMVMYKGTEVPKLELEKKDGKMIAVVDGKTFEAASF